MKSITHFNKQTDDTSARTDMPLVYSDLRARAKAHEINPRQHTHVYCPAIADVMVKSWVEYTHARLGVQGTQEYDPL